MGSNNLLVFESYCGDEFSAKALQILTKAHLDGYALVELCVLQAESCDDPVLPWEVMIPAFCAATVRNGDNLRPWIEDVLEEGKGDRYGYSKPFTYAAIFGLIRGTTWLMKRGRPIESKHDLLECLRKLIFEGDRLIELTSRGHPANRAEYDQGALCNLLTDFLKAAKEADEPIIGAKLLGMCASPKMEISGFGKAVLDQLSHTCLSGLPQGERYALVGSLATTPDVEPLV